MRIEVLCTGDELLCGLTPDTNSPYFMAKLYARGQMVAYAQTVPDDPAAITSALRAASQRADVVLVSGGLGPTADDVTAESAARAAGVRLVEDAEVVCQLKERFSKRGIAFTENNARQARIPEGATVVPNPVGSAPMFILSLGRATLFFVPGVPREYKHLVEHEVLPRIDALAAREPTRVFRASRLLKTIALPESHLDALVAPLAPRHPKVSFGFRTQLPENHLKLLAEGPTQADADAALEAAASDAIAVLRPAYFGADEESFAEAIRRLLAARKASVAVAESLTGGMVSEVLSQPAGASEVFAGGAVVYRDARKRDFADVPAALLELHGPVSAAVAQAMAEGIRRRCEVDFGLAVTGYAGPTGGTLREPLGTMYCALAGSGETKVEQHRLPTGDRERARLLASAWTLDLLRRTLEP